MFNLHHKSDLLEIQRTTCALTEANAKWAAISRSMAMIEFGPTGVILDANENFCAAVGYALEEIRGKHHRIFCEDDYASSVDYQRFWRDLGRGEPSSGTFQRLNKKGQEVWLEASYMPVFGVDRQVTSVIKVATDITARVHKEHENQSLVNAVGRAMAVIEFSPDGRGSRPTTTSCRPCITRWAKWWGSTTACSVTARKVNRRPTRRSGLR